MKAISPYKRYHLPDNGVYAPIGSMPNFHTEYSIFNYENHGHKSVPGYIMHTEQDGNSMCTMTQVLEFEILEPMTKEEQQEYMVIITEKQKTT